MSNSLYYRITHTVIAQEATMTQQDQVVRTVPICLRISADCLEQLKQLARIRAVEQQRDVQFTSLIREAIDKTYPRQEGSAK